MKEQTLDTLARGLTTVRSRRQALALLLGTGTVIGLGTAQAKKGGNGKGKGKGKGKNKPKVFICHKSDGTFTRLHVSSSALKGHRKHGDIECGTAGPCETALPTCDATTGACTYAPVTDGTECTTESGEAGICTAGVCA